MELHCPNCGECLTDAHVSLGDRWCAYCGSKASDRRCLAALSRDQRARQPLSEHPEGITLSEDDFRFRIELTAYDEVGAAVCWLTAVAMTVAGVIFQAQHQLSVRDAWICAGISAAIVIPLAVTAAWATWGAKVIEGTAEHVVLGSRLGRWAWRRAYARTDIRSVELVRGQGQDSEGRSYLAFYLVLRLADDTQVQFGAGQPYPRLAWVARYFKEAA